MAPYRSARSQIRPRGDIAVHGVETLEHDQLRPVRSAAASSSSRCAMSLWRKILLLASGLADAFDHRIVVPGVRQDQAVRHQPGDGRDPGLVRDIAGGEDEGRVLARAGRRARAQARPAGDWCRRCCGCRRRRFPCASRSRPWRRSPSGAGPCRGSRSSTRSRLSRDPSGECQTACGKWPLSARDPQTHR